MLFKTYPAWHSEPALRHFVSLRKGGVSSSPYQELNLGLHVGDSPEAVIHNRQLLAQALAIPLAHFCFAQQTHGKGISIVSRQERGRGSVAWDNALPQCDAMLTSETGICLTMLAADCVLILLFDKKQGIIGNVHAGWRGTVQKILQHTIETMQHTWNSKPTDIQALLCPCVQRQSYEVGQEVIEAVHTHLPNPQQLLWLNPKTKKFHLDLHQANYAQLIAAELPPQNISLMAECTYVQTEEYFSVRRQGSITGRFAAGIYLLSKTS